MNITILLVIVALVLCIASFIWNKVELLTAAVFTLCIRLLLCLLLLFSAGCALIPSSKTRNDDARAAGQAAASYEAMLRAVSSGSPQPIINISNLCVEIHGTNNAVNIANSGGTPYDKTVDYDGSGGLTSESSFTWSRMSKTIIPWGIRLMFAAAGIFLIVLVWKYVKRSSAAAAAISDAAERRVADFINKTEEDYERRIKEHKDQAAMETDQNEIKYHLSRAETLQAEKATMLKRAVVS